ncbi:MAG TPA: hypothetical protein VGQ59_09505 [Cyclobacteriaceae bacterium]|jgi:hypothetical protein|nr:hypothetical protein [Cyclobacteriaceae bacterium]
MKKYWILVITVTGLLLITFYRLLPTLTEHGIVNLNKLVVTTKEPLIPDKVKVIEGFFSINRHDDSELFYNWSDSQIIYDGVNKHRPTTGHGENGFLIVYDNEYYFQFCHVQTDEHSDNTFDFILTEADSSVYIEVKIDRGMNFKRKMNPVNQAKTFLTNRPLESIKGGHYNGIELE